MNHLINWIITIIVSVGTIMIVSIIARAAANNEARQGKSFLKFIFSGSMLVYLFIVPFPVCFVHLSIDYILHWVLKLFKINKPYVKETSVWSSICIYYFVLCFTIAFIVGYIHYYKKGSKNPN